MPLQIFSVYGRAYYKCVLNIAYAGYSDDYTCYACAQ